MQIMDCIEKPGAPSWAGHYFVPDEHGRELQIHLCTNGYDNQSMHEREDGWDPSFGSVEPLAKDRFLLTSVDRSRQRYLRLMRWDRCTYAVYEDQMIEFINMANGSWGGGDFPRKCVETKAQRYEDLNGYPELPPQWRDFQLKNEVVASVTSVEAYPPVENKREYRITISAGRTAGLRPGFGMWLFCSDEFNDAQFVVDWTSKDESEAIVAQYDPAKTFDGDCVPKAGQKVSSRIPKNAWGKKVGRRK